MYLPIHETINEFTSTYDQTLTFQNNSGWAQIDERPKQPRIEEKTSEIVKQISELSVEISNCVMEEKRTKNLNTTVLLSKMNLD